MDPKRWLSNQPWVDAPLLSRLGLVYTILENGLAQVFHDGVEGKLGRAHALLRQFRLSNYSFKNILTYNFISLRIN